MKQTEPTTQPVNKNLQQPTQPSDATASQKHATDLDSLVSSMKFPVSMNTLLDLIEVTLGKKFNDNTVKTRWIPDRVMPMLEGVDCPSIKDEPSGKFSQSGVYLMHEWFNRCVVSLTPISDAEFREILIQRHGLKPVAVDPLAKLKAETEEIKSFSLTIRSRTDVLKAKLEELKRQSAELDEAMEEAKAERDFDEEVKQEELKLAARKKAMEDMKRKEVEQAEVDHYLGK